MTLPCRVVIIDHSMGNLYSVRQALARAVPHATIEISKDPHVIRQADRIIFPGQGAMPNAMRALADEGLAEIVRWALHARPVLAICVGMQLLFEHSAEGETTGLGLWPGRFVRFMPSALADQPSKASCKVPHMGWNTVAQMNPAHPMWHGIPNQSYFYFVHSYCLPVDAQQSLQADLAQGVTHYAGLDFVSVAAKNNVWATQCHPEKSAAAGLQLYANFCDWQP